MATIVDGKKISKEILGDLQTRVKALVGKHNQPHLAVVLVGNDKPSQTYVGMKEQAAEKIGIKFSRFEFPGDISKEELILEIKKIQNTHGLSGLIVQLPVPEKLWPHTREIVDTIDLGIDVDCLSHLSLGRVMMNNSPIVPPTPGAILEILKYYKVDLQGKHVCLVGRGDLIGKPLAAIFMNMRVALSVHGRDTKNLSDFTKTADVIITGVGKKNILTAEMVKDGCVVIDGGVSFEGGKMAGDVDFENVQKKASLITPVPGGVGPITVAKLLENTVFGCEQKN
ncbi:MAG: bifunctional methylenetetrahydrofolate dehydrogenase/methenyltetrahydrofolate cyclohydrolase [Candidatus Doudnabacteria bacterium CG10_big_fil_rev_8_21_14_0_10_41_10]|uniref:Bifunctional protein FolD n=1 Tax=Candidatus Doudnabacteria bacterium CG10_big_fil_rev_8_21_14_0_10_41_10 TaxID=1974551 RepID=A0A2H0VEB7_9BACT|nr:MAG: bifunctional methylenetetrahydrofolate dehydrogenase/methenyltetrahydrofolate cyclohydrolase [Candidatus Doudnabacteria bacterium CG10_big_fil_rev_8_21_14_0_10_41_10]